MKIRSINPTNINKLRNAFFDYLLEEAVKFDSIGLIEEGEQLVLLFEDKEKEKAHVFKFDAKLCIGQDPGDIAKKIIEPMLPKLKENKNI